MAEFDETEARTIESHYLCYLEKVHEIPLPFADQDFAAVVMTSGFQKFISSDPAIKTDGEINISEQIQKQPHCQFATLVLSDSVWLEFAYQILRIEGKKVLLAQLVMPVIWDLSAAVLIHQIQLLSPSALLMMGQGKDSIILEAGALIKAASMCGFNSEGMSIPTNAPISDLNIVTAETKMQPQELGLPLKLRHLSAKTISLANELNYPIQVPTAARPENTYICNQVSAAIAMADQFAKTNSENSLSFANGKICVKVDAQTWSLKNYGFLHLPKLNYTDFKNQSKWFQLYNSLVVDIGK